MTEGDAFASGLLAGDVAIESLTAGFDAFASWPKSRLTVDWSTPALHLKTENNWDLGAEKII